MLMKFDSESDDPDELLPETQSQQLTDFWNVYRCEGDSGAAYGGVMDSIEREVTEALYLGKPGLGLAESLTAKAILIMNGLIDP